MIQITVETAVEQTVCRKLKDDSSARNEKRGHFSQSMSIITDMLQDIEYENSIYGMISQMLAGFFKVVSVDGYRGKRTEFISERVKIFLLYIGQDKFFTVEQIS